MTKTKRLVLSIETLRSLDLQFASGGTLNCCTRCHGDDGTSACASGMITCAQTCGYGQSLCLCI